MHIFIKDILFYILLNCCIFWNVFSNNYTRKLRNIINNIDIFDVIKIKLS